MKDKYVITKYLRLSLDDGDKPESDSISNQRNLIDFHIQKLYPDQDVEVIEIVDDGFSGTNMNRPGIKRLLILAETHRIDCIIVKDFSRFARDYIEVGRYTDKKFHEWKIRFISINDNYDSNDFHGRTGGIDVAMKSIAYTMYSRDLSQKVKSARKTLYKKGVFCSAFAFYGYMKSPEDKHKLIVDKEAAEIVKRIFNMRLNGFSNHQIAVIFNEEKILTPAQYKKSKDPLCRDWNRYSALQCWNEHIVAHLVKDERYTGKMISGKTETVSVGSSKIRCIKREDQIVVENTHEPIISQEIFDAVNKKKQKQISQRTETDISLKGLVFCGGCRHKLTYYVLADKSIKFYCDYKKYSNGCNCFQGKIMESELAEIIVSALTKELEKAVDTAKAEKQIESISKKNDKIIQKLQLEIISNKHKRLEEYKNFTKDIITEEEFILNRNAINDEILSLEKQIGELKQQSLPQEDLSVTKLFKRYIGTDKLNNDAVHDLIKAIYVYPDSRIEILWNFKDTNN